MGFDLTPEQQDMRDLAHRFAEKEIRPIAAEYDELEEVPWDVIRKAAQTGLTSYYIPEKYGGGGVTDTLTHCLVGEEIAWGCAGVNTILEGVGLAATPILLAGSEDQKAIYLSRFCDPNNPALGAFALTEPSAGSDPGSLVTEARRDGKHYVINGYKTFITNAGIADVYVVFATLDISQGTRGITAFIVEKDTPGLVLGKKEKKMGIRASHTATLAFEDMRVPVENRLGEEGDGFKIAMQTFEHTRTYVAVGAMGLARAAYEYALDYARQRIQFGKPIINHQAIGFMLADMAIQIDAARLLCWRAATLADQGKPCTLEASMAKAFAAEAAMKVTTDAVQILGGYGYSREYPVEKWMRDAKIMQIYEGTDQIQRMIIARQLAQGHI
ncbi:MAG: acyl-CoA dehydrogenase family protein [Anaerolineae bacterium]|nr:acyl-CoA dehydrogenase family protein [Anaerolineae bacterium]